MQPPKDDGVSWEMLPPSGRAPMGSAKPRGSVRLKGPNGDVEYVDVPACVSRLLARRRKAGEVSCGSREELLGAIESATRQAARERVAQLVARRDYSTKEMCQKLEADGFSRDVARATVDHAASIGLVSNRRFADAFVRGKVSAGWGIERIVRELAHRGVDASDLEGWPYDYVDPDDERARAWAVASRKRVREPNAYAKLVRFLMGRGYSYGVSTSVAKEVIDRGGEM